MLNLILGWLKDLPKDYVVMIVAALPVSELRGAIPLALSFGIPLMKAYWLSVIGNCIFVAPVLFLLQPVSNWLRRFWIFEKFFNWL
ncbi:MAG: small multi-drug export protein, partial [Candidatus Omnitrophica bacterium]|nr:small multi-drug export protein [Candidatus Omnitrophota bacterium]